jgi:excisionase family DNA binding protein
MPVEVVVRTPIEPSAREVELAKALEGSFSSRVRQRAKLVDPSGRETELTPALHAILSQAIHFLAQNRAVAIVPYNKLLTTQEAADLLNVSRPYLVTLLDSGAIPYEMVGTHRRIRFSDLMRYREMRDATRRRALTRLTQQSRRLGLYR